MLSSTLTRRSRTSLLAAPLLVLGGCAVGSPDAAHDSASHPFGWMTGCWNTAEGSEEFWRLSQHGDQLFGYSVTLKQGQRVFFELMRLDVEKTNATFFAYPRGQGPTAFTGKLTGRASAEFINTDNDYPQRIRYAYDNGTLTGTIALIDNTNVNTWEYTRCAHP